MMLHQGQFIVCLLLDMGDTTRGLSLHICPFTCLYTCCLFAFLLFCIHKCIPDKTSCISLPTCFPVDLFPCLCPCPVFLDHALSYICQSPVIFFSRSLSEFCLPARRILGFQMLLFKHLFYIHLHSAAVEHTQNSHVVQCDF